MECDSEAEPAQHGNEKIGCQSSVVKASGKNGGEEDDSSEKNEKSTSLQPTCLKARGVKSFRRSFV